MDTVRPTATFFGSESECRTQRKNSYAGREKRHTRNEVGVSLWKKDVSLFSFRYRTNVVKTWLLPWVLPWSLNIVSVSHRDTKKLSWVRIEPAIHCVHRNIIVVDRQNLRISDRNRLYNARTKQRYFPSAKTLFCLISKWKFWTTEQTTAPSSASEFHREVTRPDSRGGTMGMYSEI